MNKTSFIKRFSINGLHYYKDFEITFDNALTILVGENGLGKTTILNIVYALLKKRWLFLSTIGFDSIEIEFENNRIVSFTHSELDAYLTKKHFIEAIEPGDVVNKFKVFEKSIGDIENKFIRFEEIITSSITNPILYLPNIRNLREDLHTIGLELPSVRFSGAEIFENELSIIENEILIPLDMRNLPYLLESQNVKSNFLHKFIDACNKYLVNTKMVLHTDLRRLSILNKVSFEELSFKQLSSGERQILYIFYNLYLSSSQDVWILVDEPELSLSITWQRTILADIVNSGKCSFLLAITHSPFTFDNELDRFAKGINMCFK